MKKFLFTLVFLFTCLGANAQTDSTSVIIYKDIKATISALGESLKVPAEHVYEVMVKQQIVYSVAYSILVIILFALTFIFFKISKSDYAEDMDFEGFFAFCSIIAGVVGALTLIFVFEDIVTGFINPEYGAIKDILDFIKQ